MLFVTLPRNKLDILICKTFTINYETSEIYNQKKSAKNIMKKYLDVFNYHSIIAVSREINYNFITFIVQKKSL